MLRKLVQNHMVAVALVAPNIVINLVTQSVLDVYFGWTGWLSILAWLIGGSLSLEWGILWSMWSRSNFKVGRWRYSYATEN